MSGPYGTDGPPAILIAWSNKHGQWRATAVMSEDDELAAIEGPSTGKGDDPAAALQQLLARRFCASPFTDEFPATMVAGDLAGCERPN